MKHKIMRILQLVVSLLTFLITGFFGIFSSLAVFSIFIDGNGTAWDIILLCSVFGANAAAIAEIVRWVKKKKFIILHMIWLDFIVVLLTVIAEAVSENDSVVAVFYLIVLAVITGVPVIVNQIRKKRKERKTPDNVKVPDWKFTKFSAEWLGAETVKEYCVINGINQETELSGYQNFEIWLYCTSYIAYLFAWLVKHDAIVGVMLANENARKEIGNIKNETSDPSEFLYNFFDGKLVRNDISEQMHGFLDGYYEDVMYRKISYEKDYERIVRKESGKKYCISFSWDTFREFEQLLDRRYEYYLREACLEEYDYDGWLYGEEYSETFRQKFEIRVQSSGEERSVSDEYVKRCTEHMKNFPSELVIRMCMMLNEWNYEENQESVISQMKELDITVLKPYGDETAYIIGFEADFESEHGISAVIRGDRILEIGYRSDWSSPWSEENDRKMKADI